MVGKKRTLSKSTTKQINQAVKRARVMQTEVHRRAFQALGGSGTMNRINETWITLPNDSNGSTGPLNACIQGVDVDQRVGSQVKESGLRIKGMIAQTSTLSTEVCSCVRVVVVRDHDGKGSALVPAEVFQDSTSPNNIGSLVNWNFRKRFTFLFDQTFTLQAQAGATTGGFAACTPVDIDLRAAQGFDNTLTYNANTIGAGSLMQKGVYLMAVACNMFGDPLPAALPSLNVSVNFFFHDV